MRLRVPPAPEAEGTGPARCSRLRILEGSMEGSNRRRPETQDRSIDPPRLVNHLQLRCT